MVVCKFCQNTSVVKHGLKNGLQRYLCRECGHHFIDNGVDFPRMRNRAYIKGWKSLIKMATTEKIKKEVNMDQPIEVRMKI